MTKGELRKARKAARAEGRPLIGELALSNQPMQIVILKKKRVYYKRDNFASRAEQYGRYLDCGPAAWDDK